MVIISLLSEESTDGVLGNQSHRSITKTICNNKLTEIKENNLTKRISKWSEPVNAAINYCRKIEKEDINNITTNIGVIEYDKDLLYIQTILGIIEDGYCRKKETFYSKNIYINDEEHRKQTVIITNDMELWKKYIQKYTPNLSYKVNYRECRFTDWTEDIIITNYYYSSKKCNRLIIDRHIRPDLINMCDFCWYIYSSIVNAKKYIHIQYTIDNKLSKAKTHDVYDMLNNKHHEFGSVSVVFEYKYYPIHDTIFPELVSFPKDYLIRINNEYKGKYIESIKNKIIIKCKMSEKQKLLYDNTPYPIKDLVLNGRIMQIYYTLLSLLKKLHMKNKSEEIEKITRCINEYMENIDFPYITMCCNVSLLNKYDAKSYNEDDTICKICDETCLIKKNGNRNYYLSHNSRLFNDSKKRKLLELLGDNTLIINDNSDENYRLLKERKPYKYCDYTTIIGLNIYTKTHNIENVILLNEIEDEYKIYRHFNNYDVKIYQLEYEY